MSFLHQDTKRALSREFQLASDVYSSPNRSKMKLNVIGTALGGNVAGLDLGQLRCVDIEQDARWL